VFVKIEDGEGEGERTGRAHVHQVVPDVEEERTRDDAVGDVGGEEGVGELGEGGLERSEEDWGHDETETVHLPIAKDSVCKRGEKSERRGGVREGSGEYREEGNGG
jgi:hypothetical protein